MKTKKYNKAVSIILLFCMIMSLWVGISLTPASADSAKMLVWDNVKFYSRLHYRPDTGNFVAGGKYMFSFDYDNLTKTDESNFWGIFYRSSSEENSFKRIPHAELDIKKTDLANGYHYDVVFTVPDNCYESDNILFKFGDITSNGYIQTMKLGNLDLWELDSSDNKTTHIELSLPASISDIPTVKTDNVIKGEIV